MESSPRPGYYPDPSVEGYIRFWDGSKWVPGTSKPMPKKTGGSGDAGEVSSGTETASAVSSASSSSAGSSASSASASSASAFEDFHEYQESQETAEDLVAGAFARTPAIAAPRPLADLSFDDAKPSPSPFASPRSLSEVSFDTAKPEVPRPASQPTPGFPAPGRTAPQPSPQVAGMGISFTGAPGMQAPPNQTQTPAQMSAANQSLRIRLLRPDGKPFDGPEITTGPKKDATPGSSRTEFDTPRGSKIPKQAPKVVVKTGPLERAGHALAVLLISAVGVVPLAYLMMQSVHDREDKLAARISVPTKMNVLDGTSGAYLGAMVVVLLVVAVLYGKRLKRRR